jgi:multiple sugar transport system permease protein
MVVVTVVTLFPFLYSIVLSFMQYNPVRPWYGTRFVGLRNYIEILTDPVVLNSAMVTLLFVAGAVAAEFVLGFLIALLFNQEIPGRRVFRALILIPMILTPVVVGLIWKFMLNPGYGILEIWTRALGSSFPWHHESRTALLTMVLVDVWQWTPFVFLICLAALTSVPVDMVEMARIDGAGGLRLLFRIIVPSIRQVLLIALILRMVDAVRVFDTVWVLTKGGPSRATEVLSVLVFREGFQFMNIGYSAALSLLFLLLVLGLAQAFIRIARFEA